MPNTPYHREVVEPWKLHACGRVKGSHWAGAIADVRRGGKRGCV